MASSRSRGSMSATAAVRKISGSGSMATSSSLAPCRSPSRQPETPSSVQCRQARSVKAVSTLRLAPSIGLRFEMAKRLAKLRVEAFRRIVAPHPLGRFPKLFRRRIKSVQICRVFAGWSLVDCGVELKGDVIDATRQVQDEPAVLSSHQPLPESGGESKVQKRRRSRVEPILVETQKPPDIRNAVPQGSRQFTCGHKAVCLNQRQRIQVASGSLDEPEKQKRAAPNRDEFISESPRLQQFAERAERSRQSSRV